MDPKRRVSTLQLVDLGSPISSNHGSISSLPSVGQVSNSADMRHRSRIFLSCPSCVNMSAVLPTAQSRASRVLRDRRVHTFSLNSGHPTQRSSAAGVKPATTLQLCSDTLRPIVVASHLVYPASMLCNSLRAFVHVAWSPFTSSALSLRIFLTP